MIYIYIYIYIIYIIVWQQHTHTHEHISCFATDACRIKDTNKVLACSAYLPVSCLPTLGNSKGSPAGATWRICGCARSPLAASVTLFGLV